MNSDPFFLAQDIFPGLSTHPSCHAPTIIALPDDSLLVAFYAGSLEKAYDVAILTSRYHPASRTWSLPRVVVDLPCRSLGNPVLFLNPAGVLHLFYLVMQGDRWFQCSIHQVTSTDFGTAWRSDTMFREETGWTTRNNLLLLSNGSILFPLSDNVRGGAICLLSGDGGHNWQEGEMIASSPKNEQPAVVQLSDNSLLAYMRTGGKGGLCWQSRSFDLGQSWAPAEPGPFKNPNSAMAMIRLTGGSLVAVYNDSDDHRFRTPLNVALSVDEGRTWPCVRSLETGNGRFNYLGISVDGQESVEFSYPAITQNSEGLIHIVYTNCRRNIRHVMCNEAWLQDSYLSRRMEGPRAPAPGERGGQGD
ncbi:MAG: sialidase family protein [Chloroflexota bacterium]|nr:sialidase family protein [Chloroflexota bacterium]